MDDKFTKKSLINLTEYFKKNIKKGYPVATLKIALLNQGYLRQIIDDAAKEAIYQIANTAPVLKDKPRIEHEIITEGNQPVVVKKSWWKRIWGL